MAQQWKTGDKVQLATGGPAMTVVQVFDSEDGRQKVCCQWFKDGELKEAEFVAGTLAEAYQA